MLTVKYCYPHGQETVFPVMAVHFHPREVASARGPTSDVMFERAKDSGPGLTQVSSGCVYVMNEFGKTVAKYDLGPYSDVPTAVAVTFTGVGTTTAATITGMT